jgi:NDP-sugar pyrophosphorylase family protein
MKEELKLIETLLEDPKKINKNELKKTLKILFTKIENHINNYIGDFPTFIEPVYLEANVEIGDDVLLGPNVYIGPNVKIGDYVELSNAVIFDGTTLSNNIKLENCIVTANSHINFENFTLESAILSGTANSENKLQINKF